MGGLAEGAAAGNRLALVREPRMCTAGRFEGLRGVLQPEGLLGGAARSTRRRRVAGRVQLGVWRDASRLSLAGVCMRGASGGSPRRRHGLAEFGWPWQKSGA